MSNFSVISTSQITAVTLVCSGTCLPNMEYDVIVNTSNGTSFTSSADQFAYLASTLEVSTTTEGFRAPFGPSGTSGRDGL